MAASLRCLLSLESLPLLQTRQIKQTVHLWRLNTPSLSKPHGVWSTHLRFLQHKYYGCMLHSVMFLMARRSYPRISFEEVSGKSCASDKRQRFRFERQFRAARLKRREQQIWQQHHECPHCTRGLKSTVCEKLYHQRNRWSTKSSYRRRSRVHRLAHQSNFGGGARRLPRTRKSFPSANSSSRGKRGIRLFNSLLQRIRARD